MSRRGGRLTSKFFFIEFIIALSISAYSCFNIVASCPDVALKVDLICARTPGRVSHHSTREETSSLDIRDNRLVLNSDGVILKTPVTVSLAKGRLERIGLAES
jgi:hypothetical protein